MKKRNYLVPTLMAAGFLGNHANAVAVPALYEPDNKEPSLFEKLRLNHLYILAGHRSHSSHGSHSSHRSSSGSGYTKPRATPLYTAPTTRNNSSTPKSSILPSSPSAATKTLPGNSGKFKKIAMQVQLALTSYGYYSGAIDGIIGRGSKAALSRFQSDFSLKVTGTITPEVLNAMGIPAK